MIFLNKNPAGKLYIFLFGIVEVIDGVVRIVSLGFLSTRLPLILSKYHAKLMIDTLKKKRIKNDNKL